ncbi:hypothetical protein [Streptomyces sp. H39-S7]|uniref:hypothetical protein n=1 Tax=Streptomyces sp. H39-S7 TaxID=3004357 RepID=UPI0022AF73F2|nr:hypothetical protein [Streptomyces sp. H39-S7]MCZ4125293.1 hypothetical protein [Streptomyces sp. H39-S7]
MSETTADELDKEQLAQLHAATLKASEACLELKKLCAVVLVPVGTLVASFGDRKPGASLFASGTLVILAFWLADSFSYFYQRKLRGAMIPIWQRRANRCIGEIAIVPNSGEVSPWRAAFNASMVYYMILGTLFLVASSAYALGWLDG